MKARTKRRIQLLGRFLFLLYLILLMYFLFFSEWYGRKNWSEADYRYNLELFKEIKRFWTYRAQLGWQPVFLNLAGNVIGFMPFGFIMPIIGHSRKRLWLAVPAGFLMSFAVECLQLVGKVGSFDVDDLFLNTMGALLGYLLFLICNRVRRWYFEKKRQISPSDH